MQKTIIIGRLGAEPEMKTLGNGTKLVNFSVAVSEKYKDANGEWIDNTEWFNSSAFGKTAELIAEYLGKGSLAYFEGKMHTRSWEKDGQKHYSTGLTVNQVTFLDSKKQESTTSEQYASGTI